MTSDLTQAAVYAAALGAVAIPLGFYMAWVFSGGAQFLAPVERGLLRAAGIRAGEGQHWTRYALALIAFNACGFALLFVILRFQHLLPLNPQGFDGVSPHLAFNTELLAQNHPFSDLVGEGANTLIFPNLSSANIAYNLLSESAGFDTIGPVLLGLRKPVHVLQLGSSEREIVNMVAIAVAESQQPN